jgi:hypothetical protein
MGHGFFCYHGCTKKINIMAQDKNKIKEPYSPENTPSPPQIIDPSLQNERNEDDKSIENRQKNTTSGENKSTQKKQDKPKLLGESETEIDDETTI